MPPNRYDATFSFTPMTLLRNLFILRHLIANCQTFSFWGMLKSALVLAGPAIVREFLTALAETAKTVPAVDKDTPEPERQRILQRLRLKLGQRFLDLSDSQLAHTMTACGRGTEWQNA